MRQVHRTARERFSLSEETSSSLRSRNRRVTGGAKKKKVQRHPAVLAFLCERLPGTLLVGVFLLLSQACPPFSASPKMRMQEKTSPEPEKRHVERWVHTFRVVAASPTTTQRRFFCSVARRSILRPCWEVRVCPSRISTYTRKPQVILCKGSYTVTD